MNRRISRTANGLTTQYLYDDHDVVLDKTSDGATVDYLNGPGIDQKLRQSSAASGRLYFLQDHLGSTIALTNGSGVVVEREQYGAYGANTGNALTRYLYTGREFDQDAGLMYYRARYYDPAIGRFLGEDPKGFLVDKNFYEYVYDNPVNLVDPLGLYGQSPKRKPPKMKGDVVFFICCKKGKLGFCDGPMASNGTDWVTDCEKTHEKQHIDDINAGKFPSAKNTDCSDPSNEGQPVTVDLGDEKNKIECAAYTKELQCLQPAPGSDSALKNRRDFVKKQIDKYCNACSKDK